MKAIIKFSGKKYVNLQVAVSKQIISKRVSRQLLTKNSCKTLKFGDQELVEIDLFSKNIQNRLLAYTKVEVQEDVNDYDRLPEVEFILSFAYNSETIWKRNLVRFNQIYLDQASRIILAKTYSLIHAIIGLNEEGYSLKILHAAYKNLSTIIKLSNFCCEGYNYFTSKLKELREGSIEVGIINANNGIFRQCKKFALIHSKYIIKFYADPARFKYKKIKELVNHEVIKRGFKPISLSTIKMFLAQPEIQNTYKPFRLGRKWASDMLYPYLVREKPKKINYQWQSDCTCLNFYVYDDDGKASRRWLCIVIDVKSRKILSAKIGKYETADLIIHSLMSAIYIHRVIPYEFVHDNSKAFCSNRVKEIESRMEELGSYIRLTEPENAKDKGCIESLWGILQTDYFRNERGYLGNGVRSFQEEGRVDLSLKNEYFKDKKNGIWTDSELEEMVFKKLEMFNNSQL